MLLLFYERKRQGEGERKSIENSDSFCRIRSEWGHYLHSIGIVRRHCSIMYFFDHVTNFSTFINNWMSADCKIEHIPMTFLLHFSLARPICPSIRCDTKRFSVHSFKKTTALRVKMPISFEKYKFLRCQQQNLYFFTILQLWQTVYVTSFIVSRPSRQAKGVRQLEWVENEHYSCRFLESDN